MLIECQSSVDQDVNWVLINTWRQMPLVQMMRESEEENLPAQLQNLSAQGYWTYW